MSELSALKNVNPLFSGKHLEFQNHPTLSSINFSKTPNHFFQQQSRFIFFVDALSQILDRILSTPPHLSESFREFSSDILLGIVENFSHITEWLLKKTAQELFEKYHHPFYQPSTIYDLLKTWLSTSTLPPLSGKFPLVSSLLVNSPLKTPSPQTFF